KHEQGGATPPQSRRRARWRGGRQAEPDHAQLAAKSDGKVPNTTASAASAQLEKVVAARKRRWRRAGVDSSLPRSRRRRHALVQAHTSSASATAVAPNTRNLIVSGPGPRSVQATALAP